MRSLRSAHFWTARSWPWAFCAALPLAGVGCGTSDGNLTPTADVTAAAVIPCIGVPADSDSTA